MSNRIRLSDEQRMMLEHLVDPGKAPALIQAVQSGANIIVCGTGNPINEHLLLTYLKEIGADVTDGRRSLVIQFSRPKQGLGGTRPAYAYRNIRSDQV